VESSCRADARNYGSNYSKSMTNLVHARHRAVPAWPRVTMAETMKIVFAERAAPSTWRNGIPSALRNVSSWKSLGKLSNRSCLFCLPCPLACQVEYSPSDVTRTFGRITGFVIVTRLCWSTFHSRCFDRSFAITDQCVFSRTTFLTYLHVSASRVASDVTILRQCVTCYVDTHLRFH